MIGEGGASSWSLVESDTDEDIEVIEAPAAAAANTVTTQQSTVTIDSDSDEEDVVVLESGKQSSPPVKPSSKPINLTHAMKRKKTRIRHNKH